MKRYRWQMILCMAAVLAIAPIARAQRNPDIGYVYPAGGRQGVTFQVAISGQYLDGATDVVIYGGGIKGTILEHVKPLNGKQIALLRDRIKELQEMMKSEKADEPNSVAIADANAVINPQTKMDKEAMQKEMADIKKQLANPKNRIRDNPQLAEDITIRVAVAADAEPGERELRLKTALGLSNPLTFYVGKLPEYSEKEPNNKMSALEELSGLPLVINGQIMPGDVDCFRLKLNKGVRLVVSASARELNPYLADAVPGWFQATLALYDANGTELAYVDDYTFHPDPVLFYEILQDGDYVLEIKDAIYRGREDFVYRITVGELPFVTSIFPLGGPAGEKTTIRMKGCNLPTDEMTMDANDKEPGIIAVSVHKEELVSNCVPFSVDTLPECLEQEPNDRQPSAQKVTIPIIVNGRIDKPGDWDVFSFEGRAGDKVVAEVYARRLNSPLDSILKLTDANDKKLIVNDDYEDKGAGLTTHHADSYLSTILPANGIYYLHLGDAQQKGGAAYSYRLRISPPQPDFELRVVPSSINARAGATVPVNIYALRKDGFTGDITLVLKDAPEGFKLNNSRVPVQQEQVKIMLKVPPTPTKEPISLSLEGSAVISGREIVRPAIPADDMMQAFIYHHLVPAKDLKVVVLPRPAPKPPAAKPPEKPKPKS
jgi:hypothetical protein